MIYALGTSLYRDTDIDFVEADDKFPLEDVVHLLTTRGLFRARSQGLPTPGVRLVAPSSGWLWRDRPPTPLAVYVQPIDFLVYSYPNVGVIPGPDGGYSVNQGLIAAVTPSLARHLAREWSEGRLALDKHAWALVWVTTAFLTNGYMPPISVPSRYERTIDLEP